MDKPVMKSNKRIENKSTAGFVKIGPAFAFCHRVLASYINIDRTFYMNLNIYWLCLIAVNSSPAMLRNESPASERNSPVPHSREESVWSPKGSHTSLSMSLRCKQGWHLMQFRAIWLPFLWQTFSFFAGEAGTSYNAGVETQEQLPCMQWSDCFMHLDLMAVPS